MKNILDRLRRGASPKDDACDKEETAGDPKIKRDIPVVWLLGRTGAGKSSLIRALTGMADIEIGNGYISCTRTSHRLNFPADDALVSFLDTRGLGEAGYDPTEDLAFCEGHSHAIILVARLDDPVQGEVANALRSVLRRRPKMEVLLVHTGKDLVPDEGERDRSRTRTAQRFAEAAGRELPEVVISLPPDRPSPDAEFTTFLDALVETLPSAGITFREEAVSDAESHTFLAVRNTVLRFCGAAAASDAIPLLGLFTSTSIQFAMFKKLGDHYGVSVTPLLARHFVSLLGLGVGGRIAGSIALRQAGKFVPVYGQTVGAAVASAFTFGATYALGRTASRYLYKLSVGEEPTREDMQATFRDAIKRTRSNDR